MILLSHQDTLLVENIEGWTTKRKLMSRIATLIAKKGLDIKTKDPMSGFFAFKKILSMN